MIIIFGVLAAIAAALWFVMRRSSAGSSSLEMRLNRFGIATAAAGTIPDVRGERSGGAVSRAVDRALGRGALARRVGPRLERADVKMSPAEFVTLAGVGWIVAMAAGLLFKGTPGLLVLGVVGLVGPWFYLGRRAKRRQKKFVEQLADNAQMMGNSMRAGFSIHQAMELVANEGPDPSSREFERVITEIHLGLTLDNALEHLLARMYSEDLELMIVAINVQRQVGGNLAEILTIISQTVRERTRFQREVRTMTAQARYSSYIITALPIGVGIVINLLMPDYESYLYMSTIGHIMLGGAVTMLAIGFYALNRIADIEV